MLQIQFIRDNQKVVLEGLSKRKFANPQERIDAVLKADKEKREAQTLLDQTLAESKTISHQIGVLYASGENEKASLVKKKTGELKKRSKELHKKLIANTKELERLLFTIPNIPHSLVSSGQSDQDNEKIFAAGVVPELHNDAQPHWELAKKYKLIDFELGTKVTGAGFPVYKGKGAKLQRALINYFLDKNTAAGYTEVQVPHLVNEASGIGTGQLPDKEGQMYYVDTEDLYLIPTAEVPVTNMFRGNLIPEKDLPITCTAYSPCFRREAGSYGSHVRGLNRLHQFDKVEIVRLEHPNHSYKALDEMVAHVKKILNELGLPYRILRLCGGDLGFTAALTLDFEVFSTAQQKWLEVSSVSNFETFQANRLKLRFKSKKGKNQLVHTLNGSSLALPRVLAGILENYQTKEGIQIPEVLVPYTGFSMIH